MSATVTHNGERVGTLDLSAARLVSATAALRETWAALVRDGVPRWRGGAAPGGGLWDERSLAPVGPDTMGLVISALEEEGYEVAWDE